ncbi:MAG: hypothetical protein LC770_02690 [Acidobacteria bacterium]|nr:hypothetical protein [Acidobacteriota bacterium]
MLSIYRTMYLSRKIDDKEIQLKGQNKIFFQISGAGHEAVLVAAGTVLKPGYDWFYPYYRDRALCLQLGMTPLEQLLSAVGAEKDPNSHGRQMPSHWGHKKLNIVSQSSPTGTQLLQAVGCAEAGYRVKLIKELKNRVQDFHADEVAYVSLGDGTSSEGECWEALNSACNLKLPVLFLLEDNGYAISVPVEVQTPGGDVSKLLENFPNLHIERCDGTDLLESYAAIQRAVQHCREGKGPALVHAKVIRPYSHSLSDDERLYRPDEERTADSERDPVKRFGGFLIEEGITSQDDLQRIKDGVDLVYPSNALDANGLLRTAIRCDDPVLFLEHKHLYRQTYNKSQYPPDDFMIPFGKAKIVREGTHMSIIAYGALVQRSVVAAKQAEQQGISVEVIDLRSLSPYDWNAIVASVKKTNKVLVAHEDSLSFGYGAEIAARIAGELFEYLDAPVHRVAALDTFVAYAPQLEDVILPQAADVAKAIQELYSY